MSSGNRKYVAHFCTSVHSHENFLAFRIQMSTAYLKRISQQDVNTSVGFFTTAFLDMVSQRFGNDTVACPFDQDGDGFHQWAKALTPVLNSKLKDSECILIVRTRLNPEPYRSISGAIPQSIEFQVNRHFIQSNLTIHEHPPSQAICLSSQCSGRTRDIAMLYGMPTHDQEPSGIMLQANRESQNWLANSETMPDRKKSPWIPAAANKSHFICPIVLTKPDGVTTAKMEVGLHPLQFVPKFTGF